MKKLLYPEPCIYRLLSGYGGKFIFTIDCLATGINFSIYIVELRSSDTFHEVFFMREETSSRNIRKVGRIIKQERTLFVERQQCEPLTQRCARHAKDQWVWIQARFNSLFTKTVTHVGRLGRQGPKNGDVSNKIKKAEVVMVSKKTGRWRGLVHALRVFGCCNFFFQLLLFLCSFGFSSMRNRVKKLENSNLLFTCSPFRLMSSSLCATFVCATLPPQQQLINGGQNQNSASVFLHTILCKSFRLGMKKY